jgi:hypothetical protein
MDISEICSKEYKSFLKNPIDWIFKDHIVGVTITILFVLFIYSFFSSHSELPLLLTSLGSILLALKYKLDQANYNRELFEKRHEIVVATNNVLREFTAENSPNKDMIDKMSGDILIKAYALFNSETYRFLIKFREALLTIYHTEKCLKDDDIRSDDIIAYQKKLQDKINKSRKFIGSLADNENILKKFPEYKISLY